MDAVTTILGSAVRQTAPLAFATCGEYTAERSGTLNISIEAMMLGGAFFGVLGTSVTGTVAGGLVLGSVVGFLVAFVHAQLSHRFAANTFVVGLSLNALLLGLTSYLLETTELDPHHAGVIKIPLLSEIPWIGEPLFKKNRWPIYLLVIVIPLTKWLIDRTRWGLEVRSAGEDPQAADVTGIDVNKRRRQSLYYCGVLSGLGGAYLSVGEVGVFNTNMVAGGGFLVNAAVIFGAWRLGGALMGCALFGTAASIQLALPALGHRVTPQLLIVLPYILALAAMVIFASRGRKPAALARPFVRGLA